MQAVPTNTVSARGKKGVGGKRMATKSNARL